MRLVLDSPSRIFATQYIPSLIEAYIGYYYSKARARAMNRKLRELGIGGDMYDVLVYIVHNLKAYKVGGKYVLEVDKNKMLPNSKYNLDTLASLFKFGTADVKGYDVLGSVFDAISENMLTIRRIYEARNGVQ